MTRADDESLAPTVESVAEASTDDLGSMASALGALAATPLPLLRRGTLIDHLYRVERAIGEGGMGVVYLARDVRLDRDVAIKLGTAVSGAALARAGREALALALLSHPNVVVVYQVGEVAGRLYIAMEYVAGGSARAWAKAKPHSWREIVALYAAAGDGLAAAHAAGLVHRDVKPDNVLVGDDGRPRVGDFGLVRGEGASDDGDEPSSPSFARITQVGTVMGTPAYMAPEQVAGADVDARADQYAFCASMWEALFGEGAVPGRTPDDQPAGRVPRHVVAALDRGLARDRDARWPSMEPLLAELRRDPRARRRTIAIAATAAVVAAAIAVPIAMLSRGGAPDPCGDGGALIAASWSPTQAARLDAAFEGAGLGDLGTTVHQRIDQYAVAWAVAHRDACRATRVDGSQSEAMLDRRMLCLDRARDQLDAIVDSTASDDKASLAGIPHALVLLPDIARCADLTSLGNLAPLPADPATRARIDDTQKLVARIHVIALRGNDPDPMVLGDRAVAEAHDLGWAPLLADAERARAEMLLRASSLSDAVTGFDQSFRDAIAGGDDVTAAWDAALSGRALATSDPTAADRWLAIARAYADRFHQPADIEDQIAMGVETQAVASGDTAAGVAAARRAIAIDVTLHDDPVDLADDHDTLADALAHDGQLDEAGRESAAAVALAAPVLGDHDPTVARYREKGSEIARVDGRLDDAVALGKSAVDDLTAYFGADAPATGHALMAYGSALTKRGDHEGGLQALTRAFAIAKQADNGSFDLAIQEANLAFAEVEDDHAADAVAHAKEALATLERIQGKDSPTLETVLVILGGSERTAGDLEASQRDLERAVHLGEVANGADDLRDIDARIELSYTLVARHRAHDAVVLLEPILAKVAKDATVAPDDAAECHTAFADALWNAGGDHARAIAEETLGRDGYAKLGASYAAQMQQADAWLGQHPS